MTATPKTSAAADAKAPKAVKKAASKKATKPAAAKPAAKTSTRRAPSARAAGKRAKPADTLPENHTPSEAVAFEIRMERNDLTPSVQRILGAGLAEPGTFHAINLFRTSLTAPGDPNRNPAVAIEAGRIVDRNS